jgi:hypothetical protein
VRRALTLLAFIPLLWSASDTITPVRRNYDSWARLRSRQRPAPDVGWDRFYGGLAPLLPPGQPVGLVLAQPAGTPAHERQYYFLQYALTPRLVLPGTDHEFVIVYGPAAAAPSLIDTSRFTQVRAFEDEFALYRRNAPAAR